MMCEKEHKFSLGCNFGIRATLEGSGICIFEIG